LGCTATDRSSTACRSSEPGGSTEASLAKEHFRSALIAFVDQGDGRMNLHWFLKGVEAAACRSGTFIRVGSFFGNTFSVSQETFECFLVTVCCKQSVPALIISWL
jgi:hypothetical protein